MKDAYSFTSEGLTRIALAGLTPQVVWSQRRLVRHLTESASAVFGVADGGVHVVVALVESDLEDNDWDVVGARLMDADEVATFDRFTGRLE